MLLSNNGIMVIEAIPIDNGRATRIWLDLILKKICILTSIRLG